MKKILDFYRSTNQFVNDAFDQVIVNIHLNRQECEYKSIMFCGCEPGVGTTTLAINTAISMAISGWKTILLDGDMRKISQYKRLNEDTDNGLSDFLSSLEPYDQIVYETNYDNLYYIPGGSGSANPVSLLCSSRLDELLAHLLKEYDYIIIDMPSVATSVDSSIIASKVDTTVLVAAYAETDKKSVRIAKDILSKKGNSIMGIIMNKVDHSAYRRIMKNFDYFKNRKYINKKIYLHKSSQKRKNV